MCGRDSQTSLNGCFYRTVYVKEEDDQQPQLTQSGNYGEVSGTTKGQFEKKHKGSTESWNNEDRTWSGKSLTQIQFDAD